jgi:ribosomal protein S18 acetylase RimI-like enzyme
LTPEQLQIAIDQRSDSTVVEIGGGVAGFANFYRWNDRRCCIGNLVVAPLARGQGVATYLIQTMIHLASIKHAANFVEVSCFNQNTAGLLLYKKLGFEPFDIEERVAPNGKQVALIHMRHQAVKTQPVDVTDSQSPGNFDRIEIA